MLYLFETFRERVKLSERECTLISRRFQFHTLAKRERLLSPGQSADFMVMVQSGSLRSYLHDLQEKEFNLHFSFPGHWMTDIRSFQSGDPSELFIESVEKSEVWMIDEPELQLLLEEVPALKSYFLSTSLEMLGQLQQRVTNSVTLTAKEHYRLLSDTGSPLLRKIPQYHLASYLGITPESLSRIRKELVMESTSFSKS